jgi:hypothetical protein
MIDSRFSASRFEELGLDTQESRRLADLLADEIQTELHNVIAKRMEEIRELLNRMGHNLKPEYPPKPGDISYRDEATGDDDYPCRLRIGVDTVISTGYAHLIDPDDE